MTALIRAGLDFVLPVGEDRGWTGANNQEGHVDQQTMMEQLGMVLEAAGAAAN